MTHEIRVPSSGESVSEVEIGEWLKSEGDAVAVDEALCVLETDKASMELASPASGVLSSIRVQAGERVAVGDVIGIIEADGASATDSAKADETADDAAQAEAPAEDDEVAEADFESSESTDATDAPETDTVAAPSKPNAAQPAASTRTANRSKPTRSTSEPKLSRRDADAELVPMSLLRQGIARRLVEAQANAALLTTFNEIDCGELKEMRSRFGEQFEKRHGVRLGFMSLFVKAVVEGLKEVPELNSEVHGKQILFHRRFDIGIAVGSERGLVVPVLRNADRMSLAEIESTIADFGARAKTGQLELDELQDGTFTITNGGIFGSLMSTPIVNPPQSGVLGMHAIQDRPVVRDGAIIARPMMYVALTYDHRVVDGRGAVSFLMRVKAIVEDPERLILEA